MSSSPSGTTTTTTTPQPTSKETTTTAILTQPDSLDNTGKWMLFFASATIFLYGGAFYGWGPMQLLLEDNGHFADKCYHDTTQQQEDESTVVEVCDEQTAALLNVRFYSQLTLFASPLLGIVSDRYGATMICLGMAVFAVTGVACLMVAAAAAAATSSSSLSLDWMLYVAFGFMGLASTGYGMMTVETGLVFPPESNNKLRSRVISGMNSLYDAGAVTYWGLWGVSELMDDVTLTSLAGGYLVVAVFCLFGYWFLFRSKVAATAARLQTQNSSKKGDDEAVHSTVLIEATNDELETSESNHKDKHLEAEIEDGTANGKETTEQTEEQEQQCTDDLNQIVPEREEKNEPATHITSNEESTLPSKTQDKDYVKIADRPFGEQMKSQLFIMLAIFFSFHQTSNIWTLTTARDFLKYLGDDDYGNRYLTIFTLLTPVSLLALPFVDVAIHKYGFHMALQGVNILAIAHGTIKVASTNLNVQIVGFVIFSFFRCFLFSVSLSCLPTFISPSSTGRAVSTLYCISGALTFLNIPFASLALEQGDGNFFLPNLLYLLMTLPMILVTWIIGKGLERDGKADSSSKV